MGSVKGRTSKAVFTRSLGNSLLLHYTLARVHSHSPHLPIKKVRESFCSGRENSMTSMSLASTPHSLSVKFHLDA